MMCDHYLFEMHGDCFGTNWISIIDFHCWHFALFLGVDGTHGLHIHQRNHERLLLQRKQTQTIRRLNLTVQSKLHIDQSVSFTSVSTRISCWNSFSISRETQVPAQVKHSASHWRCQAKEWLCLFSSFWLKHDSNHYEKKGKESVVKGPSPTVFNKASWKKKCCGFMLDLTNDSKKCDAALWQKEKVHLWDVTIRFFYTEQEHNATSIQPEHVCLLITH